MTGMRVLKMSFVASLTATENNKYQHSNKNVFRVRGLVRMFGRVSESVTVKPL
jgi:hypothetical protein